MIGIFLNQLFFSNKFEIPHVGIPKDSQPAVKLSRPQRTRCNRKLKKFLEISESDNHKSNNVFPINYTVSSLSRSSCESYVPKVDDNVDCELLEGQPRRTITNTWYVDSGCSRYMTGNIRLLEYVININGGYVAFAGNKGGYITGQGTLKNDKFKFEKVNYVEQLEHYLLSAPRRNDTYVLDMSVATTTDSIPTCLLSKASESDSILWHRKLSHINYRKMNYLVKNDLVFGVPKMKFSVPDNCIPCKKGKQHKKSHKSKTKNSIVTPLELLHMDLSNRLVSGALVKVRRIRSDNGSGFKNRKMGLFCLQKGIHHEFSAPYVPQQNGVAERKNRTSVETARTILADSKRPPKLDYFLPFGNPCTLLKVRDVPTKFSAKAIEGIFLGYVANSTTKRVYNKETRQVEEWFHIDCSNRSLSQMAIGLDWAFDYYNLFKSVHLPSDISPEEAAVLYGSCQDAQHSGFLPITVPQSCIPSAYVPDPNVASCSGTQESDNEDENDMSYQFDSTQVDVLPVPEVASIKELKAHLITNIIGNLRDGVQTRSIIDNLCLYTGIKNSGVLDVSHSCFISQVEPKNVEMALRDNNWIEAMQEELAQFDKLKVWNLVDLPKGVYPIGFNQQEGIDYTEVYAPVSRLEAIWLFLAFASYKGFKVFQLDVKSAFLYGKVKEEVYVCQSPGFEDPLNPSRVFNLDKALYGLHQAPRACRGEYLLVKIYVDDIIFGSTNEGLCKEFESVMKSKFEMSAMGELSFYLGLQVNQKEDGFFIHQSKYVKDILSRFKMEDCTPYDTTIPVNHKLNSNPDGKEVDCRLYRAMIGSLMYLTASRPDILFAVCICSRFQVKPKESHLIAVKRIFRYLKGKQRLGLWFPHGSNFEFNAYTDSDFGGCCLDKKSTTGRCQFLDKKLIELVKVHTDDNFADLFTKAFDRIRFQSFEIKHVDTCVSSDPRAPREFWSTFRVPTNSDNRDFTAFQRFDFPIHDFHQFFNEPQLFNYV
ncbi:hypothetical protein L1987_65124 [Smallanthus sonchifolius]|uniref:Uncharacterized protein n=1 Tax=Smallanthus sonchifolius TaxID=185202 RepID=A0ACB9BTI5_9ASTR|nr:hypothetical protein L1987_65124 [Smallanthus sonchifolius]